MEEKDYKLNYDGDDVQELLDRVNERRVYDKASVTTDGIMSSSDKKNLMR